MAAETSPKKSQISPSSCVYTSYYCEENVWKLCEKIRDEQIDDLLEYYAVFISNASRKVPLWMQKSASDPLSPVVWDYHVVLVQQTPQRSMVYDLDSILPFPCPFDQYIKMAIQSEKQLKKQYNRKFRVVPASIYLTTFASDRSHMRKSDGNWVKPPPPYGPIRVPDYEMNLDDFIEMIPGVGYGDVMDQKTFIKKFTQLAVPKDS